MKKKAVSGMMLTLLLIGTLTLAFNIQPVKADPKTIYVDDDNTAGPWDGTPEHPYQNITSGLEHAAVNDAIYVYNGTYYENIVVNKAVSLIGEDPITTIIDGRIRLTADNIHVSGFTIYGEPFGIMLEGSSGNIISDNIVSKGYYSAIYLGWYSNDNAIVNNTITAYEGTSSEVYDGVYIERSSGNMITGNTVTSKHTRLNGLRLYDSSNNIIIGNTISTSKNCIVLSISSSNTIYHNNFINNTKQASSSYESVNIWDDGYPSGGNYWSDHNPPDIYSGPNQDILGRDGIGDKPYIIDGNNTDRYPLIYPYGYVPSPDVNDDGIVDIHDVVTAALAFGSYPGHPRWNIQADLNNDGLVDIFDMVIIGINYGKTV